MYGSPVLRSRQTGPRPAGRRPRGRGVAFAVWLLLVLALAVAPGGGPPVSTQIVGDVLVIVLGTALVGLLLARD